MKNKVVQFFLYMKVIISIFNPFVRLGISVGYYFLLYIFVYCEVSNFFDFTFSFSSGSSSWGENASMEMNQEASSSAAAASSNSSSTEVGINVFMESSSGTEDNLENDQPLMADVANLHAQIADVEIEEQLFSRIRHLENELNYGLPPQCVQGEYERLVRDTLEGAINVQHYNTALLRELHELRILELKSQLQDQLHNRFLSEPRLEEILQFSTENNLRKKAFEFIEEQVLTLSEKPRSFERNILEGTLHFHLRDVLQNGTRSPFYKGFLSYLTDGRYP